MTKNKRIAKIFIFVGIITLLASTYFIFREYQIYSTGEIIKGKVVSIDKKYIHRRHGTTRNKYIPRIRYEENGIDKIYSPIFMSSYSYTYYLGEDIYLIVSQYGVSIRDSRGDLHNFISIFFLGLVTSFIGFFFKWVLIFMFKINEFLRKKNSK